VLNSGVSPITHFLAGWILANGAGEQRRDRALVAIAGVMPDADGLGIVAELLTRNTAHPLNWWSEYHHVLGHNLGFALLTTAAALALATKTNRWRTAMLVLVSFNLHLVCDLVGARGPDGDQWPIDFLAPFSHAWPWVWSGQWALNAWQNFVITGVLLAATFYFAWRRGFSPLEMVSSKADRAVVDVLQRRFARKA
jgi:inner membrane protein